MTIPATPHSEPDQARQPRPGQVQGQVPLVTRGIGEAISRALAADGADVAAGYWHGDDDASSYITGQIWAVNGGLDM